MPKPPMPTPAVPTSRWLTIIGIGEDGAEGLSSASKDILSTARCVMGSTRHLALLGDISTNTITWPIPFADGLPILMARRGEPTVVLASGDPFWFGAGSVITRDLAPEEWFAIPGPSTPSLACNHLGWALEKTTTLALHAAPFTRLRPHLAPGARIIATLRDGDAPAALATWLTEAGYGETAMQVLEALGGPRERIRTARADDFDLTDISHPVAVALTIAGDGALITAASGRADALFDNDGQITKRPVRALTLSALAPRPGERLWDIGGGSGSIAIEWLLSHPTCEAISVERDAARAARIRDNAAALGQDRLHVVEGAALDAIQHLPTPDAVFIGGGLSGKLLTHLFDTLPAGTRIVANAVTLESEALLTLWRGEKGGDLLRIELAEAQPLGTRTGWRAAYPVVQWSVTI